jgi:hypothetical protein
LIAVWILSVSSSAFILLVQLAKALLKIQESGNQLGTIEPAILKIFFIFYNWLF